MKRRGPPLGETAGREDLELEWNFGERVKVRCNRALHLHSVNPEGIFSLYFKIIRGDF